MYTETLSVAYSEKSFLFHTSFSSIFISLDFPMTSYWLTAITALLAEIRIFVYYRSV